MAAISTFVSFVIVLFYISLYSYFNFVASHRGNKREVYKFMDK